MHDAVTRCGTLPAAARANLDPLDLDSSRVSVLSSFHALRHHEDCVRSLSSVPSHRVAVVVVV